MYSGEWDIPSPFEPPPQVSGLKSTQRTLFRDNWSGVSGNVQRKVKISPGGEYKYKEKKEYTVHTSRILPDGARQAKKRKPSANKPTVRRKPKMLKLSDNSPSKKVKMEIRLEKTDKCTYVTEVKVGTRVRWQNVKREKRALRYHPAIAKRQTVMSAIDTMKSHKTLNISLTKDEAVRYKAGDLLEGNQRFKPKPHLKHLHMNTTYNQQNNFVYNAGPSTSHQCIGDDNYVSDESDFSYSDSYSSESYD